MANTNTLPARPFPKWLDKTHNLAKLLITRTGLLEILHLFTLLSARYLPNRSSVYVSELILPVLLVSPLLLITYIFYYQIFKRPLIAHLANFCMLYVFFHFEHHYNSTTDLANSLSPVKLSSTLEFTVVVLLIKLVLSALFAYMAGLLLNYLNINKYLPLLKIFSFVVIFLFATQGYKIIDFNLRISDQTTYKYQIPNYEQDQSKILSKPDIYYLVFDRYTSDAWLKDEYGFDNSNLNSFLKDEGFFVKDNALSNYPFTGVSVSSTLAMEYHNQATGSFKEKLTTFPIRSILNNPPVMQLLKQNGYTTYQVGSWWGTTSDKSSADYNLTSKADLQILNSHKKLTEFQELFNDKSVGSYLYQPFLKNVQISEFDRPQQQIDAVKNLAPENSSIPKFVFGHFLIPHPPYLHDKNGESPSYNVNANDYEADEKEKYINQLQYTNTLIKDLIGTIRRNSPNAIIILQADEGPYPKEMRGKNFNQLTTIEELSDKSLLSKYSIQAAYYFPNPSSAAKINSSVDAFRVTLSDYLGYSLPSLPSCQYSGRSLINVRLNRELSPDCPVLE